MSDVTVSVVRPASTVTPPETLTDELLSISASVDAPEVTCADARFTPPESDSEIAAMYASTVAWFWPRERTVRLEVFVGVDGMSPANDASVRPATVAIDLMTFTASAPTAALVAVEPAWLMEVAKT